MSRVYHIHTTFAEQDEMRQFVEAAAKAFSANPQISTYGCLERGSLLAIRHGLMERGVKVVKLHDDHIPVVFDDAVLG